AGGFRLVLVESSEARAIIGGATLIDRFGESFRAGEHFRRLALDGGEALLGGLLGGIRADLNHPPRFVLRLRWRGRRWLCWRLGGRRFRRGRGGRGRWGGNPRRRGAPDAPTRRRCGARARCAGPRGAPPGLPLRP